MKHLRDRVKGWDHHPMLAAEAQSRPQLANYVTDEMMAAAVTAVARGGRYDTAQQRRDAQDRIDRAKQIMQVDY